MVVSMVYSIYHDRELGCVQLSLPFRLAESHFDEPH